MRAFMLRLDLAAFLAKTKVPDPSMIYWLRLDLAAFLAKTNKDEHI